MCVCLSLYIYIFIKKKYIYLLKKNISSFPSPCCALNLNISRQGKVWEGWLWSDLIQLLASQFPATGFVQGERPDARSCPGGIFLCDAWARLLDSGENNHVRFPKLLRGSNGKFLLYLPPETYPAAASSPGEFEQGSLYLCNRWCCNRKSTF